MRSFLTTALIGMMALPAASVAQMHDPWAGYDVRDIRQLRDEAAGRRERLRYLARQDHAARKEGRKPSRISKPVRSDNEAILAALTEANAPVMSAGRPPRRKGPAWTGAPLAGTAEERATVIRGLSDDDFRNTKLRKLYTVVQDGFVMLSQGLRAEVSISEQTMRLLDGEELVAEWPVSTGRSGYDSTRGNFGVSFLSRNHRSRQYDDAPMPCAVFYNGGEAIHGTSAVSRLGKKASHGCVRLETKNACTLYDMVAQRGKGSLRVVVSQ